MEQRETPDGDVYAAGRRMTFTGQDEPGPEAPQDGEPEDACDGEDDGEDAETTSVRRTFRDGPAVVNQTAHAGRDAFMVSGSMTVNRRD